MDGEAYFGAVADALERARRRVLLVGWDFHTGVRLRRREGPERDPDLVHFLDDRVRRSPHLEILVLEWDFAMLYALERQMLPRIRFGAHTHRRLRFALDGEHPTGASHHQKLVVVDDALAFTGGLDLGPTRWDTRAHSADDPRREDPGAGRYAPFHDVGIVFDGEAAAAVAGVARERWQRATGELLPPVRTAGDPWPSGVAPDFRDVELGIARTDPGARPPRRDVEALYLASIRGARRLIYAENQYLSSDAVADALAARLAEPHGPEIVIVGPRRCDGWLEQNVMGARRARIAARLREADRHGRLRLLHPLVPGVDPATIRVHAKLMVVDDRLLRLGSANLSNRSMGLDTELDVAIEADPDTAVARRIAAVRRDLLAEHLGCSGEEVEAAEHARGSLIAALDALRGGERSLAPLDAEDPEWLEDVEGWLPDQDLLDPERPVDFDELVAQLLPDQPEPGRRRALWTLAAGALALLALVAAWHLTPLSRWATPDALASLAGPLRRSAWGPWAFAGGMAVGATLMLPVTALIVAASLVFGPWLGFVVAWLGAMGSALLGYALGRSLWRDAARRLMGERLRRLSRRVGERGVTAVAALRVVPVAPYAVVNLAAGASHVKLRDYLLGTLLAMTPGILALTVLSDRVLQALREPGPASVALAVAVAAGAWAALRFLRRRLGSEHGR